MFNPVSVKFGPFNLSLSDQGSGLYQVAVALSGSVGGGNAAGVVQMGGQIFANLNAAQVLELGFEEFNKVLPATVEPVAAAVEGAVEAEVKSL